MKTKKSTIEPNDDADSRVLAKVAAAGDDGATVSHHGQWRRIERLADLGLVERHSMKTVTQLANGNVRIAFKPWYRLTDAGRRALLADDTKEKS